VARVDNGAKDPDSALIVIMLTANGVVSLHLLENQGYCGRFTFVKSIKEKY
jgi:hypothetical protein